MNEYFKDWISVLDLNELYKVINNVNKIKATTRIVPEYKNIFKAFNLCTKNNCKIVFLGQDPYPQLNVATGILFGNKGDTPENSLSPSLQIIREAAINYEIPHSPIDFDITLESWAKQGVLMLNSSLTCEVDKVGSHTMLWRPFISKLLNKLSNTEFGIIYVLFGEIAHTFEPYINNKMNTVFKVSHPAYYARNNKKMPSTIFNKIDEVMINTYGYSINWYENLLK
jgi:uracil-DNA glycosylase